MSVFESSRLSMRQWLYVLWLVAGEKRGVSAKSIQNALGLGSYKTAWFALHKIRRAMTRTSPDKLSCVVEVDESYVGGVSPGTPGRSTKKAIVIAVERLGWGKKSKRVKLGRVRMRVIENTQRRTLEDFITDVILPGSIVHTDGKKEYDRIGHFGYTHQVTNQSSSNDPAHVAMPGVHRVASLVKRWVLGTHQVGGLARQHLEAYLDEFTFRFNRRASRNRGLVFYRLLEQCLTTRPLKESDIVMSRRGQRGKRRGPAPKPRRAARRSSSR
jgi:transposase-like protein